jgi:hypothetical protein
MTFTFPVYITVNAKSAESAKKAIRIALEYQRHFASGARHDGEPTGEATGWSYTISPPICSPCDEKEKP